MHIYMSYADEDKSHGDHLKRFLKSVAAQFDLTVWSVQDVRPGRQWHQEMASHLKQASLFVPLISVDHFVSERCEAELDAAYRLEQRGLPIVCVLIRPVDPTSLGNRFVLPERNKPITTYRNRDVAWGKVQSGILDVMRSL